MKTKTLLSVFAAFFFSLSIYADSPKVIKFSNIEETTEGCVKEFLYCDEDTKAPLEKTVYPYDLEGRMLDKASYKWNDSKGWVGTQKFMYKYSSDNQPQQPTVVKWNDKKNCWCEN